ncbi:MAG: hypothetical protein ACK5Q5_05540, partial [Planctomycetaceae bacterium]
MPTLPVQSCLRRLPTFVALLVILLISSASWAQSADVKETEPATPADRTIYVPFKSIQDVLNKSAASAIVPYEAYLRYLESLGTKLKPQPADAVLSQAEYTARIEEDVARITAKYTVNVLGQPWVELPLSFGEAAVGKLEGGEKVLLRGTGEGTCALLLGEQGEQTITLELLAKVRTSPEGREFSLSVPTVGVTTLELTVPDADQAVEVTPRLILLPGAAAADGTTTIKASLGATKSITARWHPKAST